MEIKTKAMGTVSVLDRQIISLNQGFYGFGEFHTFALIDAEQKPFVWVQSTEKEDLGFLALDPFLIRADYEIDLDDSLLAPLGVTSPSDVLVFVLITISPDGSRITANLQGPLIINRLNNRAMQAILADPRWETKHDLLPASSEKRGL